MKPRRSVLYVPADKPRALEKARGLNADVLILDLEDAVADEAKQAARQAVLAAVPGLRERHEVVIRVNAGEGNDLALAVQARADAILLPKVRAATDIAAAARQAGGTPIWAMIETPQAVLDMAAIARAGVTALVLGANDLLKEMGGQHRADCANLHYVMSQMVLVARAHGIAALDAVHNGIGDDDAFTQACLLARDFGFDGKTLIHPSQIAPANAAFSPDAGAVATARKILAAFAANPGKGALLVDGQMVEKLHADIARRTIARAQKEGALP